MKSNTALGDHDDSPQIAAGLCTHAFGPVEGSIRPSAAHVGQPTADPFPPDHQSATQFHPRASFRAVPPWRCGKLILACAGNSRVWGTSACRRSVHPGVRGEQIQYLVVVPMVTGSSPRARGTALWKMRLKLSRRFIPACAGNSYMPRRLVVCGAVHPRVRGEQAIFPNTLMCSTGSSPRARGTGVHRKRKGRIHRFIPACAGNRAQARARGPHLPVHPRVRGEQEDTVADRLAASGSSPRARGTARPGQSLHTAQRFIPACAGNSCTIFNAHLTNPVHPRVRGEQVCDLLRTGYVRGSSPRARGTGRDDRPVAPPRRFIPACAGNSGAS